MNEVINKTRVKELKTQLLSVFREIEETANTMDGENVHNFRTEIAETIYKFKEENGQINDILGEADCMGPAHKYKTLSIIAALYFVKDEHLLKYANNLSEVKSFIEKQEPGRFTKERQLDWLDAKQAIDKLIGQVHTEFFERISLYSLDRE